MIKFSSVNKETLTQAIINCGWDKNVDVNTDGTLNWFEASDYPTNDEIYAQMDSLIDNWTHDQAVSRLAQYELAVGREEVTETVVVRTESYIDEDTLEDATRDITEEVVVLSAIDPLPETITTTRYEIESEDPIVETIENPLITKDKAERAWAQSVLDA